MFVSQSTFDCNVVGISTPTEHTSGSGGVFNVEHGSTVQVGESTFTHNYAKQGGVFNLDSSNLEVNETNFYGNNASIGTLIAACGSNNISLDFQVSLNFTSVSFRNCTLYDLEREISVSITVQAVSIIAPVMTVSPSLSTQFAVGLSSTCIIDLEQSTVTTNTYYDPSPKATSKGMFTTSYPSKKATTEITSSTAAMTNPYTSVKPSSNVMTQKVSRVALSSTIQLTVSISISAAYYTPLSPPSVVLSTEPGPIVVPSSDSGPIVMPSSDSGLTVSSVTDLSTEESSIISSPQVAGPNLGIRIAIPVVVLFVVSVIIITFLIIIVYARKSKNCKTVNILTNMNDPNYTYIPLVGADGEKYEEN